jgi:DinB family protein
MTPAEIADVLESSGRAFVSTLTSVPDDVASWHPAEGEWCIKQVVGHVTEAEKRGFAGRIRIILGAADPDLPTWDRASISHARRDCDRPAGDLAAEFTNLRHESVDMVRGLRPEQLTRGGNHPEVGRLTIDELLHEWVHHDGNHLRQALANVQASVWRSMGNTQRFSTG